MAGFYHLKTSKDFFVKTKWDYEQFVKHRSGDRSDYYLFNLLASLTHLREWIYPQGHGNYDGSLEAKFHEKLHNDDDFRIIREMANSGKHFNGKLKMAIQDGFRAGSRAGDPLDVRNYYIEDSEVLDRIERLLKKYRVFFATCFSI